MDKSDDKPNAKRPKMEQEDSTTSTVTIENSPFTLLPADVLSKIIMQLSVAQWATLESLDTNFRASALLAWRKLRNVNVERDLMIKKIEDIDKSVALLMQKLSEHSPFLTSISGVDIRSDDAALTSYAVHSLAQFEHLHSLSLGSPALIDNEPGLSMNGVVEFLELTRSRTSLKELQLNGIIRGTGDRPMILDQFALVLATGREIQSSLKLEKFSFASFDDSLHIRLDTIDTSRLTDVRLGKAWVEPQQLTTLIERASKLDRIELSFMYCPHRPCNAPHLDGYKKSLTALSSHENLTAIKFDKLGMTGIDKNCTNFGAEFIEMLITIGRRGKLRKLALGNFLTCWTVLTRIEICAAIRNCIPYLQSIKLIVTDLMEGAVHGVFSLSELEEIYFSSWDTHVSSATVRTIAQLPWLKRLALDNFSDMYKNSLMRLADAKSLVDLRIGFAHGITAEVFDKWSVGCASNLQILMLSGVADGINNRAEQGLTRLLQKASRLRVLLLHGNITDQSLMAIAQSCPELETVGVRSTSNLITVQHLQEIVDRCPKLKRLGGFEDEIRETLRFPKYRKIATVDTEFWKYDFDDSEYE